MGVGEGGQDFICVVIGGWDRCCWMRIRMGCLELWFFDWSGGAEGEGVVGGVHISSICI